MTTLLYLGCPQNEKINFSVPTETNRNKICFGFVSVCFVKPKINNFRLFRCFEPISKQPKETELFRNGPKQPEKKPKDDLSQTAAEGAEQVNSFGKEY
jgi:hypothetical protein